MQRRLQKLFLEKAFNSDMPDTVRDGSQVVLAPRAVALL